MFQCDQLSDERQRESQTVRESQRNSKGERIQWKDSCVHEMLTEGVTDALDQTRGVEHVIGGSQALHADTAVSSPPWKRQRYHGYRRGYNRRVRESSLLRENYVF